MQPFTVLRKARGRSRSLQPRCNLSSGSSGRTIGFRARSVLSAPARPALLLLLSRPWLESAFQLAGFLNLGRIPKSYSLSLHKFDAWSGDLPCSNPVLQGCSRNLRHLGDLDCCVKLWTHDLNLAVDVCHLSTNGFSSSVTQR
jgi:hypothetical protein